MVPPLVPGGCGTRQGLPKSNHRQEAGISHASEGETASFDRRAIPARARESFWQAQDGWKIRRIDWPAPASGARGSILFLPGRGDHYEKYLETLDHWAGQGWHVTASDWRGQAGSGRLSGDGITGHVGDFRVWIDDLVQLWNRWVEETPAPHVLAAHSMGGQMVLLAVALKRIAPDAIVLSAPMLGFHPEWVPRSILHLVARVMTWIGDPRRPAWKWSEKPGQVPKGRVLLLTHDPDRYADELWWRGHRPELVMGPGSWGWVERAYASFEELDRPGMLEGIDIPAYVVATDNDKLVSYAATHRACRRLPQAELLTFGEEARHEILREEDGVRDRAIAGIDGFLRRIAASHAGAQ